MAGFSKYPTQIDTSTELPVVTDNVTPVKAEVINRKCLSKTEYFILRCKNIHGNKYNYDQAIYVKSKLKIKVICPTHGTFEQRADDHLQGRGCNKCCANKQMTVSDFITRSKRIHKYYLYDKFIFTNSYTKGIIVCSFHGEFLQAPRVHLQGHGCPKCANEFTGNKISLNTDEFIKLAKIRHGNKYNYDKVNYTKYEHKVIITCITHKHDFLQKPHYHLSGSGCPKCGKNYQYLENKWLDQLKILKKYRQVKILINKKRFFVDGYDPETKTIYEFNGDSWHGNPELFNADSINPVNKKTYGELYQKTLEREVILKAAGYKIVSIWESKFKNKEINE